MKIGLFFIVVMMSMAVTWLIFDQPRQQVLPMGVQVVEKQKVVGDVHSEIVFAEEKESFPKMGMRPVDDEKIIVQVRGITETRREPSPWMKFFLLLSTIAVVGLIVFLLLRGRS